MVCALHSLNDSIIHRFDGVIDCYKEVS